MWRKSEPHHYWTSSGAQGAQIRNGNGRACLPSNFLPLMKRPIGCAKFLQITRVMEGPTERFSNSNHRNDPLKTPLWTSEPPSDVRIVVLSLSIYKLSRMLSVTIAELLLDCEQFGPSAQSIEVYWNIQRQISLSRSPFIRSNFHHKRGDEDGMWRLIPAGPGQRSHPSRTRIKTREDQKKRLRSNLNVGETVAVQWSREVRC